MKINIINMTCHSYDISQLPPYFADRDTEKVLIGPWDFDPNRISGTMLKQELARLIQRMEDTPGFDFHNATHIIVDPNQAGIFCLQFAFRLFSGFNTIIEVSVAAGLGGNIMASSQDYDMVALNCIVNKMKEDRDKEFAVFQEANT